MYIIPRIRRASIEIHSGMYSTVSTLLAEPEHYLIQAKLELVANGQAQRSGNAEM